MARWGALVAEALGESADRFKTSRVEQSQADTTDKNLLFFPLSAEKQDRLLANDVDYIKVAQECA